jgi:hypothetical protein
MYKISLIYQQESLLYGLSPSGAKQIVKYGLQSLWIRHFSRRQKPMHFHNSVGLDEFLKRV